MTRGALEVETPDVPLPSQRRPGAPLRIVCPTYWYPQHATDTQATYVHDINRHLVRRGHQVTVVTPGDRSLPAADSFDGVDVVRFPHGAAVRPHLRPGGPEPGQPARARFARLAVMAHYLEAQYRATVSRRRGTQGADVHPRPLGHPDRARRRCMAARRLELPSVITMHGGDVYVNPGAGLRFPHPLVRAARRCAGR